ncbi:hypothetical protein BB558_006855, partial [Smittium angustum]
MASTLDANNNIVIWPNLLFQSKITKIGNFFGNIEKSDIGYKIKVIISDRDKGLKKSIKMYLTK